MCLVEIFCRDYCYFERFKNLIGKVVGDGDTGGYVIALTFVNVLLEKHIEVMHINVLK